MAGQCGNCDAELKSGLFGYNAPLSQQQVALVNAVHGSSLVEGCDRCSGALRDDAPFKLSAMIEQLKRGLEASLDLFPLASISTPHEWHYDTIGLVTAQTVTGTGLFSDVTSAFTDLFGTQSGAYNQKLRNAENMCRTSLRAQTMHLGGNAVLGVDVDYAEVGGTRAMLMVCMTGTAVLVTNIEVLGADFAERQCKLVQESLRLRHLIDLSSQAPSAS